MPKNTHKILSIVKGYFLKEKTITLLTILFFSSVTIFLLVGNQLFANIHTANKLNAYALEGKQHATYYHISQAEFNKLKSCSLVADAGQSFSLGSAEDGTNFAYIDQSYQNLSATTADQNIRQTTSGRFALHKNEVVFTENYMEQYGRKLGDTISVSLTAADADTGDILFCLPSLTLTIVGTIGNVPGFTDRRLGYVSKELADEVQSRYGGTVNAVVRFRSEENISENFDRLNAYLGYEGEQADALNARTNQMLVSAADENGALHQQNRMLNVMAWLICALVIAHLFHNRLFEKKRDFTALRKIGFQTDDLLKIAVTEFFTLVGIGFAAGIPAGFVINYAVYAKAMSLFTVTDHAKKLVSPYVSAGSVRDTGILLFFISLPALAMIFLHLKNVIPAEFMREKRKNKKKIVFSLMIVSLSAILISILAVQDSHSDDGMLYVKSYVPGDLQLTAGSIFENIMGGDVPSIPGKAMKELQKIPGISQIQDYRINYNRSVFLCEDPQSLNTDGAYYDTMLAVEQEIGGKPQCLYSLLLVTTNSLHTLLPSYQEKAGGHIAIMDTELADTLNLRIGDTFSLYDEPLITAASKDECRQIRVTLADTRETVLSENHLGGNLLITDQKTARFFGGRQSRQVVNIWVQNGMEDLAASSLERLCSFYGCSFHSAARQMQAYADTGKNQRRMRQFMILILGTMGVCIYFHTVFANLLSRRHDFWTMHKIGIQKKELYWMVLKEGACQGIFAAGLTGIAQAALAAVPGVPETLFSVSAWTDAGLLFICMAFPVFILFYIARKNLQF